jgi:hypothetical protein
MALSTGSTGFSNIGAGISDIFAAEATGYTAAAYEEQSAAALTAGQADLLRARGDVAEGQMYGTAASLADLNAQFTEQSTKIQVAQSQRQQFLTTGTQRASAAALGSSGGGSAADIVRSSVSQAQLNRGVLMQQGVITEAGFKEQAQSYRSMQQAAGLAAGAEQEAAVGETDVSKAYQASAAAAKVQGEGDLFAGIFKIAAGGIGLIPGTA